LTECAALALTRKRGCLFLRKTIDAVHPDPLTTAKYWAHYEELELVVVENDVDGANKLAEFHNTAHDAEIFNEHAKELHFNFLSARVGCAPPKRL